MVRGIQISSVILCFSLTSLAMAGVDPSNLLVSYSFDDDNLATGPDTFAVFEKAKGSVNLTTACRFSGFRSVEIRDVAGDGDFPELQGYFKQRAKGKLFLHFALMTTNPFEELNIALAGPAWFTLRKNGIGFWLKTQEGYLYQYSDSMPKKLLPLRPFIWYVVDVAYDIDGGTYDLIIHEERQEKPVISLAQQINAPNQPGSVVDKFSFIGDTGEDKSNVIYYVDDVVVGTDEAIIQLPFVAPGRRKLFVDSWNEYQKLSRKKLGPLPAIELADFGIKSKEIQSLKAQGLLEFLQELIAGKKLGSDIPKTASSENRRLLQAVGFWGEGCTALLNGRATFALAGFEKAVGIVPEGKIYQIDRVLSLAALGRWQEVDALLSGIYAEWQSDLRFPALSAMLGIAREDLDEAEQWLRAPAEQIPDEIGKELISRLRSGQIDEALLKDLKHHFPNDWRDYIKDTLIAEQYFFVLLWRNQISAAEQYAQRMVDRFKAMGFPTSKWLERVGDATFFSGNYSATLGYYEESLKQNDSAGILVKLSDVYFRLGDLDKERIYREKIYGKLSHD